MPLGADILLSPYLWTLVAIQIVMGGFDVIFHHELTERLAWRKSAADELKLHAARNFFYALLFGTFAWVQPKGWLAIVLLVIMLVEIVITLADFVEEDQTRKLPATERVLHTLMAINYGGVLALIGPAVVAWAGEPTGYAFVSYGVGSWLLMVAAIGVFLFGLRDIYAGMRARRFTDPAPVALRAELPARKHIVVTGGTGFIGARLVQSLVAGGHEVTVLVRSLIRAEQLTAPVRLVTDLGQIPDAASVDAIVDLAGEPVAGGLWTGARRRAILRSRLRLKRDIRTLIRRLERKPEVVISASAVGIYGLRGDEMLSEADRTGDRTLFSVRTCQAVEASARRIGDLGPRVVNLRIGLVLGRDGGLLAKMLPAFDLCLGGRIGSGRQWMSWIALDDLVRLIALTIGNQRLDGAVNATAPQPVRNADFTRALAAGLHRFAVIPLPAKPLEWVAGDFARELLLGGQRVYPAKALASGFRFTTPELSAALAKILASSSGRTSLPLRDSSTALIRRKVASP